MDNFNEWSTGLIAAEKALVPGKILKLQRQLVLLSLGAAVELSPGRIMRISGVVQLTPVDTGRARSSWNVSIGSPSLSTPAPGNYRSKPPVIRKAQQGLRGLGRYQTVWIASALPYIEVLEYGLYPSPVARGSWDRKLKKWVIKSEGGYSKQAPRGMVRITVAQLKKALGSPGS